uniref:Sodium channel regulatory subunit beta-3 n=1 Tax=Echeneis naucrates TaxID=173247 RepID=A0A665UXY1_ECHNA
MDNVQPLEQIFKYSTVHLISVLLCVSCPLPHLPPPSIYNSKQKLPQRSKLRIAQDLWLRAMLKPQWKLQASLCYGACVEVDSDTEAVASEGFKLGCISCKMRGEVRAEAKVDWFFKGLYSYENQVGEVRDPRFFERLHWNGSKHTQDLQDGSLYILNVTYNDTGTYNCLFFRSLMYNNYEFQTNTTKLINVNVVARLTRGMASILSEVMMYVSIIGLQFWLVVEMIYCYRKIAAAGEEALRESASRKSSKCP